MSNTIYNINDLCIDINTFKNNTNITSVDLKNIRWGKTIDDSFSITNDMTLAFSECTNLKSVKNINEDVNNMSYSFINCISLESSPEMPKNVEMMQQTFYGCKNLKGDVKIHSEKVRNIMQCFYNSPLPKNIYIPYFDNDGNETQTYKTFKSSGYIDSSIKDNIIIKDVKEEFAILRISVDVNDAEIYIVNDMDELIENDGTVTVKKGTVVRYTVKIDDAVVNGSVDVNDDMTVEITFKNNLIDVADYTYRMTSGDVILEKYIGKSVNIIVPILKERT